MIFDMGSGSAENVSETGMTDAIPSRGSPSPRSDRSVTLGARWAGVALVMMLVWMVGFRPDLSLSGPALMISAGAGLLIGAIAAGLMEAFGPLAFTITLLATRVLASASFDFRADTWYFGHTLVVIVLLAGLVLFAFHSALAGRSLFGKLLEET